MSLKIRKSDSDILTGKEILSFLKSFRAIEYYEFQRYSDYYAGDNPVILNKKKMPDVPDNRVPISYARKLVKTVVGYMFKAGAITYKMDGISDTLIDDIKMIFKKNKEQVVSSQIGRDISNYGVSYEYFYLGDQEKIKFIKLKPIEIIPIWSYDIDPELKAIIRFIEKDKKTYITVYYSSIIYEYYIDPNKPDKLISSGSKPNVLGIIPFNIYSNSEEYQNDYKHVIPLINAYDSLISGSMNEFERFAHAYLRLVKMKLSKDDAENIKNKRIFENLDNKDAATFLTKEIPKEFIEWMSDFLRKEIHTQTHIPDFKEDSTGKSQISGEAIDRLLYDFEFIATDKESYFKGGLEKRFEMILHIMNVKMSISDADIENFNLKIEMKRNKPKSRLEDLQLYNGYKGGGITDETLIEEFATFVEDPKKELEAYRKQESVYSEKGIDEMVQDEANVNDGSEV